MDRDPVIARNANAGRGSPPPIIVTLKPDISRLSRTSSVPGRYPGAVVLIRSYWKRGRFCGQDIPRR